MIERTTPMAVMEEIIELCDNFALGVSNVGLVEMSELGEVARDVSEAIKEIIDESNACPMTVLAGILTSVSAMLGAFLCVGLDIEPVDYMKSRFGEDWTPPKED